MKINCSKWPYTSFLIPAYQKIVIAKKADFHARRTSRSAHDRLANILRTHAVWANGERNAIMARGRLYNRNFGPRAMITLQARSLMFYNRLSRLVSRLVIILLLLVCMQYVYVCHSMTILNGVYFQENHVHQRL